VVPPPLPPGWGRPPLVHRAPIAAAAGVALVLVGTALAWAALHPPEHSAAPAAPEVADAAILPADTVAANLPSPAPAGPARAPEAPSADESPAPPARPVVPQPLAFNEPRPVGQTYGTRVTFLATPEEAMRVARSERKLVFVLHVSGNFEEACFT
jgi:hypothetical protein